MHFFQCLGGRYLSIFTGSKKVKLSCWPWPFFLTDMLFSATKRYVRFFFFFTTSQPLQEEAIWWTTLLKLSGWDDISILPFSHTGCSLILSPSTFLSSLSLLSPSSHHDFPTCMYVLRIPPLLASLWQTQLIMTFPCLLLLPPRIDSSDKVYIEMKHVLNEISLVFTSWVFILPFTQ